MTKLTYPISGLNKTESENITSVKGMINSLSNITFVSCDMVSDIVLETFPQIVSGYKEELSQIEEKIKQADSNYQKLDEKISDSFNLITVENITKREPIV